MAQTATFDKLSGSTNGLPIKVVQTGTAGTTIHTAVSGTSSFDRIYLYATNTSASPVVLTLEWGTTTAADGNIIQTIQPQSGEVLLIDGLPLNNAKLVRAFAASANVILITGYIFAVV